MNRLYNWVSQARAIIKMCLVLAHVCLIKLSTSKLLFGLQNSLNSTLLHYWAMSTYISHRFHRLNKRHHWLYSKPEVLWDLKSQTNRLQRSSKHLATSVNSTDVLLVPPIIVHAMNSRTRAQNLLSRFTFHLPVPCAFINIPGQASCTLKKVISMSVKHSGSI